MFGYIRPCRPELKLKDDALFKAYYCGVCKALGQQSGPACRLLLRYDLAFLALVRDGVQDDAQAGIGRCPVKLNKLNLMAGNSVTFAADMHLLLSAAKAQDDKRDHNAGGRAAGLLLSPAVKKTALRYPELWAALQEMMAAQEKLEADGCTDPDAAAEPFAEFLGKLFAFAMPDEAQPSLKFMGFNIGKWIYWLDALDDYEQDEKKNAYNVWHLAGYTRKEAVAWALPLLMQCISQAQLCWDVLDTQKTDVLVENVLKEGMPRVMDAVAEGRSLTDGSI